MKNITLQNINEFLNCDTIAIAGASRKPKSFSDEVVKHLKLKGYNVLLVNPNFLDSECQNDKYRSIESLPDNVKNLLVLTNQKVTESVINEALKKGIKQIWVQQKSENQASLTILSESDINYIYGKCIFMFTNPTGVHKFHYTIMKWLGKIPKQ